MKLNKKTRKILKLLVQTSETILDCYTAIHLDINYDQNKEAILNLITLEKRIINLMHLDSEYFKLIKNYIEGKLQIDLDEDLIKLTLNLDLKQYPYFRAYAKIYYEMRRIETFKNESNKSIFIDQEVLNLYRLLRNLGVKEESDYINLRSKILLLNSTMAEEEIIKNNFNPIIVYDAVEFASELYTAMDLATKIHNKEEINVNYDRMEKAILSRKNEFDQLFHDLLTTILSLSHKYGSSDSYFDMLCCYFEVIFTILDQPRRELIYKSIENSDILNDERYYSNGFLQNFIPNLEDHISEDLIPFNRHLSLFKF